MRGLYPSDCLRPRGEERRSSEVLAQFQILLDVSSQAPPRGVTPPEHIGEMSVAKRPRVPESEKLKTWVRAGGRCVFCNEYLLESDLTLRAVPLGEVAHNVAASDGGPRSDESLDRDDRSVAENLLLLCGRHHPDSDKRTQLDLLTVDQLKERKARHERRIRAATDAVGRPPTAILRLIGFIKGAPTTITTEDAVEAVIHASDRFPELLSTNDQHGVELDLRSLPGEIDGSPDYYRSAAARIDEVLSQRLRPDIESGRLSHLSVFGLARLPLLVHLGARLDDAVEVDVYQRHRSTQKWIWPTSEPSDFTFTWRQAAAGSDSPPDGVLIINASGTIHVAELPEVVSDLPMFEIGPAGNPPHPDSVCSRTVLDGFERSLRELLAHIEATTKTVRTLHVFAAAPVSVATTLGRSVGWAIHPSLIIYDRLPGGAYRQALEVCPP